MKILLTGDLHIHNYTDHNLEPNYRLNQFSRLANRLVEIAIENNCEKLIVAGDIIHKASEPPEVNHKVQEFFTILANHFSPKNVHYILGNHDCNYKTDDPIYEQTNVHVIVKGLAQYENRKVLEIDNRRIGLMDWTPSQNLEWITDPVDLFVGHVTIDDMFGQEIDHTKFKLGLAGDIHRPCNINNLHSINVPIPHYISDCQDGSVVIYDTLTNTFERVLTESGSFDYVKIYYEDSKDLNPNNPRHISIKRPVKVVSSDHVHRSIDLDDIISNVVNSANLNHIHTDFISLISEDTKPLDLNFTIHNIKVKNFLSIKDLDLDLPNGLTVLTGNNGNGKSTLIRAIDFVLRPPRSAKDFVKLGEKNLEIEIKLDYKNRTHHIKRVAGNNLSVYYSIDGVEQVGNAIADINKAIEDNLDFLALFDILYRYQSAPYLLSGFNYAERIELVSKLLGLGKIDLFHKKAITQYKALRSDIQKIESDIAIKQGVIDQLAIQAPEQGENKEELERQHLLLVDDLKALDSELQRYTAHNELANSQNLELERKLAERSALVAQKEQIESKLSSLPTEDKLNLMLSEGTKVIQNLGDSLESLRKDERILSKDQSILQQEIDLLDSELKSINSTAKSCSACGREFDNAQEIEDHKKLIGEKLDKIVKQNQPKLVVIGEQLEQIARQVAKTNSELSEASTIMLDMKSTYNQVKQLKSQQIDIAQKVDQLASYSDKKPIEVIDLSGLQERKIELVSKQAYIKSKLEQIEQNRARQERLKEYQQDIMTLTGSLNGMNSYLVDLEKYKDLFDPTGSIVKSVFITVAEMLTENEFVVRTVKTLKNKETRIDFDIDYLVNNTMIPYQSLSGGQKVIVDIFFLAKLFKMSGQVGLLMLDETLKDLDSHNLEKAVKILKEAPINTTVLVTHVESFNHYDVRYNVSMVDGSSTYQIG